MEEKNNPNERYQRQLILEGFGMAAQEKLGKARVLVAGAGGLGCPALLYLAGAGVGKIGIVDGGLVELSNLHRQVLFSMQDIGKSKADRAAGALKRLNPEITIIPLAVKLDTTNTLDILCDYDVVIDGLDNFQGKYMINDACALLGKPLIYGAITRFEGQVAVFNAGREDEKVNYRDIFPEPPFSEETLSCSEAGVLGVLPGIIGCYQAAECIKLITGTGRPLVNKLLTYNVLNNASYSIELPATPEGKALVPKTEAEFKGHRYALNCRADTAGFEIDSLRMEDLIQSGGVDLVDVRDPHEQPPLGGFAHLNIPLSQLGQRHAEIKKDTVIFVCQSGKRSLKAARLFSSLYDNKAVYSIKDGMEGLEPERYLQKAGATGGTSMTD